jgi:tetratricopeptide (TPR) repeat protein
MEKNMEQKLMDGDVQGAIEEYTKLIAVQPNPLYFHNRGIIYAQKLQNYQQAIQDYNTAISLNPHLAQAYTDRAYAHWQLGSLVAAIADYDRAISIDPQMAPAYQRRGAIHYQQGALEQARRDYLQAIILAPSAVLYYQYGLIADDDRVAMDSFDRALALDSDFLKAYCQRATLAHKKALELSPELVECLCGRGIVRQKMTDYAGAISDYQRAANLYLDRGQQQEYEQLLKVIEALQRAVF